MSKTEKQPLLNTFVNNLTCQDAEKVIEGFIREKQQAYIVEVNTDVIMKIDQDAYLKQITDEADLVLVDGKPLVWVSKVHGLPVKEKVSGSDLSLALCQAAAAKGYTLFILGGKTGVAAQAKARLENLYPGIHIAGTYAPPLGFEKDAQELARIQQIISYVHPDIVLTCLGCPKQEKWIYENYRQIDAFVFMCAGATVDFLAGNVKRAPAWVSNSGFEWFFRFLMEPKRLFKRYFVDDLKVIRLIWKYRPRKNTFAGSGSM